MTVANLQAEILQPKDVADDEFGRHASAFRLLAGTFDGDRREIHTEHVEAALGQQERVLTRAAADVEDRARDRLGIDGGGPTRTAAGRSPTA